MTKLSTKKVKIRPLGGAEWSDAEAFVYKRKGWQAPTSVYIKFNGKWIVEYRRELKWEIKDPISLLLFTVYSEVLKDLLYSKNPFLELIPKDSAAFQGSYYPVPLIYGKPE